MESDPPSAQATIQCAVPHSLTEVAVRGQASLFRPPEGLLRLERPDPLNGRPLRRGGTMFAIENGMQTQQLNRIFRGENKMSETKERAEQAAAEAKAIRQVIAESGAVDFVDVVNAVRDRFRINVTAAQVEEVYHELARETKPEPKARTSVTLTSMVSEGENEDSGTPAPTAATAPSAPAPAQQPSQPTDDLGHALHYVKSVGGLANAKRKLLELESLLLGGD